MRCPDCQTDHPPDARYCAHCGARLPLRCRHCEAVLPDDARFCARCGQPVPVDSVSATTETEGGLQGERRTITAMFADVKGSTSLAEQIDVEAWVEIMNRVLQVLSAEIHRYGGEVDRYEGDGLVAFFGATAAHEDDPERAVLAGLAMQEAVGRYAAELAEGDPPVGLLLRVGLSTGEVVTATVEDARQHGEETAMGRAIAVAARMEPAAEPGTVLVSEDTYRLVAPLFEWQAMGEVDAKGIREPVAAYRPLAHRATMGKGRGIPGLSSPLVGRDAEVRALKDALERLRAGIGGIVTIVGEAGIGKSRLVAEVRNAQYRASIPSEAGGLPRDATRELNWLEGRCLSYATGVAYHLWLDMLHSPLDLPAGAPSATVRDRLRAWVETACPERPGDVYPYLARLMSLPPEDERDARVAQMDAESLKGSTFVAVETLIEHAARRQPLVVVCEDLHWADSVSLELLGRLLSLTDRVPLLYLCVFRPLREHGCWQVRETAARDYEHRHTDLRLEPLSAQESAALVGNLLHVEDLPEGLRARILARAEGNPFYVEEILRALLDEGAIARDVETGLWRATRDVASIPIPDTVHGVIAARIDRLPEGARRVLQEASVLGRIFSYSVLAAIHSPLPQAGGEPEGRVRVSAHETQLSPHLVVLQRAQLVRERARLPEREYAFKHVLTQEAAYSSLLRRERRDIHRRAAEALERLYPERLEEKLGLLAHHWEHAGEAERAVTYLRQAGEQAAAQYANEEAIGYLSRALALVPADDAAARYLLLLAREGVYNIQAARELQGRDLEALKQAAESLARDDGGRDGTRRLAKVALREAVYSHWMRDDAAKITAVERAVRLARAAQDQVIEAAAYLEWGRNISVDPEAREPRVQRALILARAAQQPRVEADSLRELGMGAAYRGDFGAARDCYEQALRVYRDLGDRMGEGRVLDTLGLVCYDQGDFAAGIRFSEQGLRLCRETGNRYDEAWATSQMGWGAHLQGDHAGAKPHFECAMRICREIGDRSTESFMLLGFGAVLDALGDYEEAANCFERAWAVDAVAGRWQGAGQILRSLLCHHVGDDETARRYAQHAHDYYTGRRRDPSGRALTLTVLGHALAGMEDWAGAARAYREALDLRHELNQHHLVPEPLAGLARSALAQGEPGQALVHVDEILRFLEAHPGLEGTREPLRVYLTCYHVLSARADPRAGEVLDAGYRLLQERADKIDDEDLRRSYLENVAAHREIVAAWEGARL